VLECLQKALRIANSAIEEIVTVQLYCDTLDKYLFYLDRGAPAVSRMLLWTPKVLSRFFFAGNAEIREQPRRTYYTEHRQCLVT
jgi:hypothetical protein